MAINNSENQVSSALQAAFKRHYKDLFGFCKEIKLVSERNVAPTATINAIITAAATLAAAEIGTGVEHD